MKLAEALSIRKDLQKRIEQLRSTLLNNVKVQEGEQPAENPEELLHELDGCIRQLEQLMFRINRTNTFTESNGRTLTAMIAERDTLTKRVQVLRDVYEKASQSQERYSRSEIKMVTTVDVKNLSRQINHHSQRLRQLDMDIQSLNFQTELME